MKKPEPEKINAFSTGLYREHMEEAGFLFEQCDVLRRDPDIPWQDLARIEDRHEANIKAMANGGLTAVDLCVQRAGAGDNGEMHTALTLFCRCHRLDLVWPVLDQLDPGDGEGIQAASDALKHEWPEDCQEVLTGRIEHGPGHQCEILSTVAGFRRFPVQPAVLGTMPDGSKSQLYSQIWCLGRLKTQCPPETLSSFLTHGDDHLRAAAAIALSRMGVGLADVVLHDVSDLDFYQMMQIALTAARPAVTNLLAEPASLPGTADIDLVLGLMGDPLAVEPLIQRMARAADPESTALALNLITGADLYVTMQVAEPVDEAELFDDEREALARGTSPMVAQDMVEVTRLSMDPVVWQAWWHHNRNHFQTDVRYRNGLPYSPACLLDNLRSDKSPPLVRQIAAEELTTRFAMDIPFETDMRVQEQRRALARIQAWIDTHGTSFIAGQWYFAGRLLD